MVSCNENLMVIRQFYEPVQEIEHLTLRAIMANITTMNDNISLWHILYPMM